jgi:protein SCO1/2
MKSVLAASLVAASALAVGAPRFASAQGISQGPQPGGRATFDSGINAARDVTVDQRLDNRLPLDSTFRDETGKSVTLGSFFGKRPVWLVMPFYQCKNTCAMMLHGMVEALHDPALKWQVGRDFDIVVISINPKEREALASATKDRYLSELGIPGAEKGWHFLTGEEPQIRMVAAAAGYTYVYDAARDQYAHPTVTMVATPDGRLSRYLFGVVYPGKDVTLAMTEAGKGRVGSVADQLLLMCYHYDPSRNRYGLAVFRLLQVFGTGTVVLLGSFMAISLRNERRARKRAASADGDI